MTKIIAKWVLKIPSDVDQLLISYDTFTQMLLNALMIPIVKEIYNTTGI